MLIAWLTVAAGAAPSDDPAALLTAVDRHFQQVVFAETPPKRKRLKLIRKAFRVSDVLNGGRDWGRVMCFVFNAPPAPDALTVALRKARLQGVVRDAEHCDQPPPDAFLPPPPAAVRLLTLAEADEPIALREALHPLLLTDTGVSGIHLPPERSDRACLELERELDDDALRAALADVPLTVQAIAPADSCVEALGLTPR